MPRRARAKRARIKCNPSKLCRDYERGRLKFNAGKNWGKCGGRDLCVCLM